MTPSLFSKTERIEGRFAANNKVHGGNAMMIHDVRNNQIGELNVFVRVNHADLECRQDSLAETPSPAILFPLSLLDV